MSITPKEAFDAAKILWPGMERIKHSDVIITNWIAVGGSLVDIDWGDTDQYPLPEPEWVDAKFPDDVGKQGRFSDDKKAWYIGTICGRVPTGRWLLGYEFWYFCQVQKEKT